MRIYGPSEAEAQAFANKGHAYMIAQDPNYADSVDKGYTKRWAIPQQDLDDNDKPVGDWYILVEGRMLDAFTSGEQTKMDTEAKTEMASRITGEGAATSRTLDTP